MMSMRHAVVAYLLLGMPWGWSQVPDPKRTSSLQHGAQIFMNYCSGCHSLKYLRYNRMANDLGLTTFDGQVDEVLLKSNLIFTQATIYDPMQIAMPAADAKRWFGVVPPDLSLIAREKGRDWLYRYLNGFYNDDLRPFGINNVLVPNVAMPNMLEPLTGNQALVNDHGHTTLEQIKPGQLTEAQSQELLNDLLTFLVYVSEPAQFLRYQLGIFVVVFLSILLILMLLIRRNMPKPIPYKNKEILEQSNPKG